MLEDINKSLDRLMDMVSAKTGEAVPEIQKPSINSLLAEREKAFNILKSWRTEALRQSKKKAYEDCEFLISFLNKILK